MLGVRVEVASQWVRRWGAGSLGAEAQLYLFLVRVGLLAGAEVVDASCSKQDTLDPLAGFCRMDGAPGWSVRGQGGTMQALLRHLWACELGLVAVPTGS